LWRMDQRQRLFSPSTLGSRNAGLRSRGRRGRAARSCRHQTAAAPVAHHRFRRPWRRAAHKPHRRPRSPE